MLSDEWVQRRTGPVSQRDGTNHGNRETAGSDHHRGAHRLVGHWDGAWRVTGDRWRAEIGRFNVSLIDSLIDLMIHWWNATCFLFLLQGAMDDAGGLFCCLEALRIMKALGLRPKRTVHSRSHTHVSLLFKKADDEVPSLLACLSCLFCLFSWGSDPSGGFHK